MNDHETYFNLFIALSLKYHFFFSSSRKFPTGVPLALQAILFIIPRNIRSGE